MKSFHTLEFALDEFHDIRCSGCPAVMAEDLGRTALAIGSCPDGVSYTNDPLESGCLKGVPQKDLVVLGKQQTYRAL